MELLYFNRACENTDRLTSGGSILGTWAGFILLLPFILLALVIDLVRTTLLKVGNFIRHRVV